MMKVPLLLVVFGVVYSQGCVDRKDTRTCVSWKRVGYCKTNGFVKTNCQKTCGLCGGACVDKRDINTCVRWKNNGYCKTSSVVKADCQKTCGLCGGGGQTTTKRPPVCLDKSSSCSSWKRFCASSANARRTCPKTCGLCGGQTTTKRPIITKRPTGPTQTYPTQNPGNCGRSNVKARVIAGETSKQGQWPWQIAMLKNGRFSCGGSLIHPQWIVTAAHCVSRGTRASQVSVVLGDLDRSSRSGLEQTIQVQKIISHTGWSRGNKDIALLKLSKPAVLNDNVQTVCLPRHNDHIPVGTKCYISGWGKTRHPGGSVLKLQHAPLEIISNAECHKKNKKYNPIQNESVCARNTYPARQSGCHGDSGGPFVCESNGRWTLHGAVSWGSPRCDIYDAATVFARVSALRNWIDEQMKMN